MENNHEELVNGASAANVVPIRGEPAVVINGVPDPSPDFVNENVARQPVTECAAESIGPYGQGEWLKGRKVLKKFGRKYFKGKVQNYDPETNWYMVIYEDGDREEMELQDLQMVMLPLDIRSPLETWLMKLAKYNTPKNKSQRKMEEENRFKTRSTAMKKKAKGRGSHCASHGFCVGCK
ncbi:hypothetical protein SUGI_0791930 [Cryptomeria japonica]|uniref:dirigent protein 17 n=1 Tax=Cryptomeria japonica TaxID=3369 RepID=UPI002414A554|nr:dirigent protein 17 [Cryptomeria japonica]GLJ38856.1 hypothetical protein SUGI_0791930 [Cryptomeria japonica]